MYYLFYITGGGNFEYTLGPIIIHFFKALSRLPPQNV